MVGDGAFDLVYVPGFISHVELVWAEPAIARFYERLASFSRLILFDKRGTGLSDPIQGPQPLEERMEDLRAVMDAAGSERAALVGLSEGCAMATVFAATYPERTRQLVLDGADPWRIHRRASRGRWLGATPADAFKLRSRTGAAGQPFGFSDRAWARRDASWGFLERAGASPRMARALIEMWLEIDLRDVLPAVSIPTLVVNRSHEVFPAAAAREVAARIPGARHVELPGVNHVPWAGDSESYIG